MTTAFRTVVPHTLSVCVYPKFAPFCFELDGRLVGTDIDLIASFAESHSLKLRLLPREFPAIWLRPGSGECDVAAAGIAALSTRDLGDGGVWSRAYTEVRRSLLIRKPDVEVLKTAKDFADRAIVVTKDSTADIDAQTRYQPLGAKLSRSLPSQSEMVRRLLAGEIDAYAGGEQSNQYLVETCLSKKGAAQFALADVHPMDPPETLHFAIRADDPRLAKHLDEFLSARDLGRSERHASTPLAPDPPQTD